MLTKSPSKKTRILNLLKSKKYVTNVELNRIAYRYSARLAELREEYEIETHERHPITHQTMGGLRWYELRLERDENDGF